MSAQKLKSSYQKLLSTVLLTALWAMSFLLNNLQSFWEPHGSDEYSYFGVARRLVIFENKVADIAPFQGSPLLYSYWLGLLYKLTGVPLEILTRLFHGFMLFLIIFLGYQIGRRLSEASGFIVAGLLAFSFSPVFYPGQAYMIPVLFMNVSVMLILLMLLNHHYKWIILPVVLLTFLYWQAIFPVLIFTCLYFFNLRSLKHLIGLGILILMGYFLLNHDPLTNLSPFLQAAASYRENNDPNYLSTLWTTIFKYYVPALVGVGGIVYLSNRPTQSMSRVLLALLFTSFFIFFFLGTYAHLRALFFLLLPTFLFIALGYEFLNKHIHRPHLAKVLSVSLALYSILISYHMGSTYANQIATIPPYLSNEVEAFEWLNDSYDLSETLLVSDYATIFWSMYHLNTLNSNYFQDQAVPLEELPEKEQSLYEYLEGLPKLFSIYRFLSEPVLSSNSITFLTKMQEDFGSEDLFIMVSLRTRSAISLFDLSNKEIISGSLVINSHYSPTFEGEGKFRTSPCFELLYDQDDVQVYRFLINP